jgi:glycosyltransferase involved in cell wall biosynthesis
MKVCLVGHFSDVVDEGKRNVARSLGNGLESKGIEVTTCTISSLSAWRSIRTFRPDIIHFVLTPTTRGILTTKLISKLNPEAKTVLSALHPSLWARRLLKPLRPDIVLVQSKKSDLLFRSAGFETRFFPNGVDLSKFRPIEESHIRRLREEFQLSADSFVVLHLASMRRARNLNVFKQIQQAEGTQVIIVARENEVESELLARELEGAGCLVWKKHFSNVEAVYNLADCYVFPTIDPKACIETPLSVLEAMACNLPIVTTRFGALPDVFKEGSGLVFVDDVEQMPSILGAIRDKGPRVDTRSLVAQYSWDDLAEGLVEMYKRLLQ